MLAFLTHFLFKRISHDDASTMGAVFNRQMRNGSFFPPIPTTN